MTDRTFLSLCHQCHKILGDDNHKKLKARRYRMNCFNLAVNLRIAIFSVSLFTLANFALSSDQKNSPIASADFQQTIAKTTELINQYQGQYGINGISIALVYKDQIVWAEGFGYADKEKKTPATPETVYMLCSISKTMTTAMLLMLYEQGKIDLESPASTYIPELSFLPQYENQVKEMTVKRLLNHHSGMPGDVLNGAFTTEIWDGCNAQILGYFKNDILSYRPGEVYNYCNTGFMLAGEIIQRYGETNYVNFAEQNLLKPLGMNNTAFYTIKENLAIGYDNGAPVDVSDFSMNPRASGGAFTTVLDMSQFMMMLVGGGLHPNGTRILKPETVENIFPESESSPLDLDSYFVAGLGLDSVSDAPMKYAGRTWAKNGSAGFFGTLMEIIPDYDLGVIVMMNTAHLFRYEITRVCLQQAILELGGPAPSPPVLPAPDTVTDLKMIEGLYYCNSLEGLVSVDGRTSVFSKIVDNGDGTLTWFSDTTSANPKEIKLSLSGKAFVTDTYPNAKFEFKNIECQGKYHFVMVQHGSTGSLMDEYVYGGFVRETIGEKYAVSTIPAEWKNRYGHSYIPVNTVWSDVSLTGGVSSYTFSETDGVLMLNSGGKPVKPLLAQDASNALVPGTSNRGDKLVCFRNDEVYGNVLQFNGTLYSDTADFTGLQQGQAQKISLPENKVQWLKIVGEAGHEYVLSCTNTSAIMSLFDNSFSSVFDSSIAPVKKWTCERAGTYYLAVVLPKEGEIILGNSAPPVLSTPFVSSDGKTISMGAEVYASCADFVTTRGITWSIERDFPPETGTAVSEQGNFSAGKFLVPVNGLPDGTLVYYRAFAENSNGKTYSEQRAWIPGMKPSTQINLETGKDKISSRGIPLEIAKAGFSPGNLKSMAVDSVAFDLTDTEVKPETAEEKSYTYTSLPTATSKFQMKLDFIKNKCDFKSSKTDLSTITNGTFADFIIKDKDDKAYGVGIFQKEKINWKFSVGKNTGASMMPPSGFAMDNVSVKKLDASWNSDTEKGTMNIELSPFDVVSAWTFSPEDGIQFQLGDMTLNIPSRNAAPLLWTQKKDTVFTYKDKEKGILLTMDLNRKTLKIQLKDADFSTAFEAELTANLSIGRYATGLKLETSRKAVLKSK